MFQFYNHVDIVVLTITFSIKCSLRFYVAIKLFILKYFLLGVQERSAETLL